MRDVPPEDIRYRERSNVGRLRDEFGGRNLRVRGASESDLPSDLIDSG